MKNIAIIGSGQLGSRHLQALALLTSPVHIQVVDASDESLKVAESRFKEVSAVFKGTISFHKNFSDLEKELDVVIIATSSKVRRLVVENLLSHSKVKKLILEKFLFTKIDDFYSIEKILQEKKVDAWVNCPRRMIPFYQNLKNELKGPVHFTATGNSWGLGCNGIHLLDLFAFLTNSTEIHLSNNLIDKEVIASKRESYIEFTGTVTGYTETDSFHITSFAEGFSPLQVIIITPTAKYSIEEGVNSKVWISRRDNSWNWEEQSFKIPFQSELTHLVVDELLSTGNCSLTTYAESSKLHILFLNNLLEHLRKVKNDNTIVECLIT